MQQVEEARAIEGFGLEGDRHARAESSRQVLLMADETIEELGLRRGDVKENITTRGLEHSSLVRGQRLEVGHEVVLEITKPCEPCSRMEEIREGLQNELLGRRGILARVVQGGVIRVGDQILTSG